MATVSAFELRTIRRHLVCRWLTWIAFLVTVQYTGLGLLFPIGLIAIASFQEKQWPLPYATLAGRRVPGHMAMAAIALVTLAGFAQLIFPALKGEWTRTTINVVFAIMVLLFLVSQVQLWRGRGLS